MKYCVYKIINLINNKIYIGVHKTKDINDNYIGSGSLIKQAVKKYGIENFKKKILFVSQFECQAYKLEKLLVTEEFIKRDDTYNLKLGGIGGRHKNSYTDKEKSEKSDYLKKNNPSFTMTNETKLKMSKSKQGKPSNAKGNFKKQNDGKWENTAHIGENNPRAKIIYIFNQYNDIIYKCNGSFYKTLEENNMPMSYFRKTLINGEAADINLNYVRKINRELVKMYQGWYAKEIKE
jgi:hypothetical protein